VLQRPARAIAFLLFPALGAGRQTLPDGRRLPYGLVLVDSLGRLALLALLVWFAIDGEWLGVAVCAVFLLLLALMRLATAWLIARTERRA
jgi:hypothetical protein